MNFDIGRKMTICMMWIGDGDDDEQYDNVDDDELYDNVDDDDELYDNVDDDDDDELYDNVDDDDDDKNEHITDLMVLLILHSLLLLLLLHGHLCRAHQLGSN